MSVTCERILERINNEKLGAFTSSDFSNMKEMINDNLINSFDDLLFYIKQIEREINKLK